MPHFFTLLKNPWKDNESFRQNLLTELLKDVILRLEVIMEKFTAVYEKMNDGWIGYVEELSGANTQGKTRDEVKENLKEAVQLIIEADRELARREVIDRNVIREELLGAV